MWPYGNKKSRGRIGARLGETFDLSGIQPLIFPKFPLGLGDQSDGDGRIGITREGRQRVSSQTTIWSPSAWNNPQLLVWLIILGGRPGLWKYRTRSLQLVVARRWLISGGGPKIRVPYGHDIWDDVRMWSFVLVWRQKSLNGRHAEDIPPCLPGTFCLNVFVSPLVIPDQTIAHAVRDAHQLHWGSSLRAHLMSPV